MERPAGLRVLAAGLCILAAAPYLSGRGKTGFVSGRGLLELRPPQSNVGRHAARPKSAAASKYKTNEDIRCTEVRLIGELSEETNEVEEMNEILATSDAMRRARSKGLDLVLINEDKDPPLVKIVSVGKYVYEEKKRAKETARNAKVPKPKEVKVSYTIGEHDLNTKLNQMEGWLNTPRQQVKVVVQMKGRTKAFEKQARQLLTRVQEEVAAFGKVAGGGKGDPGIKKDGRGDLVMMFNAGPDVALLKELSARASAEDLEDEDDEEDEEESGGGKAAKGKEPEEIQELLNEIEETKQDLLDCGISPGAVSQQPEMIDLQRELREVRARLGSKAFGSPRAPSAGVGSAVACGQLALAAGAFAALARRRR